MDTPEYACARTSPLLSVYLPMPRMKSAFDGPCSDYTLSPPRLDVYSLTHVGSYIPANLPRLRPTPGGHRWFPCVETEAVSGDIKWEEQGDEHSSTILNFRVLFCPP